MTAKSIKNAERPSIGFASVEAPPKEESLASIAEGFRQELQLHSSDTALDLLCLKCCAASALIKMKWR